MKNIRVLAVFFTTMLPFALQAQEVKWPFEVAVINGKENIAENAFLISMGGEVTLIDAMSSGENAGTVVKAIREKGGKLSRIFITHGHPDHFLGLSFILKHYPNAEVCVANKEVRDDILAYVTYAESKGLLEDEPSMKKQSQGNRTGFDYERINVHAGAKLKLGKGMFLTIESMAGPAESNHNTILYSKEMNVLFASDLLYNNVFNWMGPGVGQSNIDQWIGTLKELRGRFNKEGLVIFPGHGAQTGASVFEANIRYLSSFRDILARTKDKNDALTFFKKIYPEHQGEYLLTRSIEQWFEASPRKSISINHIRDLTHTLTSDFPFIPVEGITFPFEAVPIAKFEDHGVRANKWIIHEHIGTQVDAPNHFARDGAGLEGLKVEDLIVPVVVIDISEKSFANADAELTVEDLERWEKKHGRIADNACVMMYSGWENHLGNARYLGVDAAHVKHFPGISLAAIRFLLSQRNISGVGVDVISIDPGNDSAYKGHKELLGAGKWAVEAVANLKDIPPNGAYLFVGAPKIKGGTGGIARLIAVWE